MRSHQRALSLFVCLLLAFGALTAGAESAAVSGGFSAKGVIEAPRPLNLLAPVGGQAEDFSWQPGDRAQKDELALKLLPALVYAPADGIVTAVQAKPGDLAENVAAQFGALCYINRDHLWQIDAVITSTTKDEETRDVRVGQTLRVQHGTGDSKVRGTALVIARNQKSFVLELEKGEFELEDDVRVYLGSSKDNAYADQIGTGTVRRPVQLPVMGEGRVAAVLAENGAQVSRGQPLFMLDSAAARYTQESAVKSEITFPENGIVGEVLVRPGMYVQQGQPVMSLLPETALEAALEVDELDISRVRVGDSVRVTVDAYQGERTGTVKQIEPLGRVVLDTTKFIVKVAFDKTDDLMVGMHVRAYWN